MATPRVGKVGLEPVRSFREIRRIIREKHGWVVSTSRLIQICQAGEAKLVPRLRIALASMARERDE